MNAFPEREGSDSMNHAFIEELNGYIKAQSALSGQLQSAMSQAGFSTGALMDSLHGGFGEIQAMLLRLDSLARQCGRMGQAADRAAQSSDETYEAGFSCVRAAQSAMQGSSTTVDYLNTIEVDLYELQEQVGELESGAKALENALTALTELAQQANLLAINANIEAARAGDRGTGIEGVARQMSLLAQTTGDATKQIAVLGQEIVRRSRGTAAGYIAAASEVASALHTTRGLQQAVLSEDEGSRGILESAQNNCTAAGTAGRAAVQLQKSLAQAREGAQEVLRKAATIESIVWQQEASARVLAQHIGPITSRAAFASEAAGGMLKDPPHEQVYRVALARRPEMIDPALAHDLESQQVLHHVYAGLVRSSADGSFLPGLAACWVLAEGAKTLVVHLRPNVRFHNGLILQAQDVKDTIERVVNPATHSPYQSLFSMLQGAGEYYRGKAGDISGIRTIDAGEVAFTFDGPVESLLSALAHPAAGMACLRESLTPGKPPAGTGPYKYSGLSEEGSYVLEVFSDYFEGRPFADRVEFRIIESHKDRKRAFHEGVLSQVDVDAGMIAEAKRDEGLMERLLLSPEDPESGIIFGEGIRGLALEPGGLFDLRRVWMRTRREF